jgi:hypothetical protein
MGSPSDERGDRIKKVESIERSLGSSAQIGLTSRPAELPVRDSRLAGTPGSGLVPTGSGYCQDIRPEPLTLC